MHQHFASSSATDTQVPQRVGPTEKRTHRRPPRRQVPVGRLLARLGAGRRKLPGARRGQLPVVAQQGGEGLPCGSAASAAAPAPPPPPPRTLRKQSTPSESTTTPVNHTPAPTRHQESVPTVQIPRNTVTHQAVVLPHAPASAGRQRPGQRPWLWEGSKTGTALCHQGHTAPLGDPEVTGGGVLLQHRPRLPKGSAVAGPGGLGGGGV
jgi:hypothetical protein